MAKKRKSTAGKKHRKHRRRSRSTTTITHPRRVVLSNPGPSFIASMLSGFAGGGISGFVTSKFLSDKGTGVRVGVRVALALGVAMLLGKKKPVLADGFAAGVLGGAGSDLGMTLGGGVVAASVTEANAAIAAINAAAAKDKSSSSSSGSAGMGLLYPARKSGMGLLYPASGRGMNGVPPIPGRRVLSPQAILG